MRFFALLIFFLLFPFFISPKCELSFIWSFFKLKSFISPSCILLKRSIALSYLSNFSSGLLPLYLYANSSRLTFLSNSVISSSLSSANLSNISFCFKINGLSLIVLTYPWSWIAFIFFSPWSSIVFICFSKAFPQAE